jgi:hypothetical protein
VGDDRGGDARHREELARELARLGFRVGGVGLDPRRDLLGGEAVGREEPLVLGVGRNDPAIPEVSEASGLGDERRARGAAGRVDERLLGGELKRGVDLRDEGVGVAPAGLGADVEGQAVLRERGDERGVAVEEGALGLVDVASSALELA